MTSVILALPLLWYYYESTSQFTCKVPEIFSKFLVLQLRLAVIMRKTNYVLRKWKDTNSKDKNLIQFWLKKLIKENREIYIFFNVRPCRVHMSTYRNALGCNYHISGANAPFQYAGLLVLQYLPISTFDIPCIHFMHRYIIYAVSLHMNYISRTRLRT